MINFSVFLVKFSVCIVEHMLQGSDNADDHANFLPEFHPRCFIEAPSRIGPTSCRSRPQPSVAAICFIGRDEQVSAKSTRHCAASAVLNTTMTFPLHTSSRLSLILSTFHVFSLVSLLSLLAVFVGCTFTCMHREAKRTQYNLELCVCQLSHTDADV